MIKIGSDFSGVGAFEQALIRNGIKYRNLFACDMDKFARQSYIANYGKPEYYPENVYNREIPTEALDIYMTSPPCQSFSSAGHRKGKDEKRGILFFNSYEFIKANKPRYFIFENVKGLLSDDDNKTFSEWVNMLGGKSVNGLPIIFPFQESVPYHVYWKVLNSKNHQTPQKRKRVFIVGIRNDDDNIFTWPKDEHLTKRLIDILEPNPNKKFFLSQNEISAVMEHLNRHKEKGNGFGAKIKKPLDIADTILAAYNKTHQLVKIKDRMRTYTPRECFRLQDFPDSFKFVVSDAQLYKQAGNSITVGVLAKILLKLKLEPQPPQWSQGPNPTT